MLRPANCSVGQVTNDALYHFLPLKGEKVWTAHEVELALWSHHHSTKQVLPSGKRKREEEPATQEPLDKPPKKRPKKSNS